MGFLNRLFGSDEKLASSSKVDEEEVLNGLSAYKDTFSEKKKIVATLPYSFGERKNVMLRLKKIIESELMDLKLDKEKEIIANIRSLESSEKIRRVERLETCLGNAATKYQHVYELTRYLYSTLVSEIELLSEGCDIRKYRKITSSLQKEIIVEESILGKIMEIRTFHTLFLELLNGEHVIHKMDAAEKRLVALFAKDMPMDGITDRWVMAVFKGMKDKIYEMMSQGEITDHPNCDFEFVNRAEFVSFAREKIFELKKRAVPESFVNAFVHSFREKYNTER